MIEVYEDETSKEPNMYCSLHCRTVLKSNETAAKSGKPPCYLIRGWQSEFAISVRIQKESRIRIRRFYLADCHPL